MTIYAVGGESEIFGSPIWLNHHDVNYSRVSARPNNSSYVSFGIRTPFGGDSDTGWWIHFRVSIGGWTSYADGNLLYVHNSAGTQIFRIDVLDKKIRGIYHTSTGGTSSIDLLQVAPSTVVVDLHCYRSGSEAKADLYFDEALITSLSSPGTNYELATIRFSQISTTNSDGMTNFSEFIAADEDTRGMRVKTVVPTGDDATHNWNGSYTAIDEYDDTADGISSGTSGETALFAHANDLAMNNVHSFTIASRVAASASNGAQGLVRLNGTNYETPFLYPLTAGEQTNFAVFTTNPATGLPFTAAELNSMAFGIKSGPPA